MTFKARCISSMKFLSIIVAMFAAASNASALFDGDAGTGKEAFKLEYDAKYFDPNVDESKRWITWMDGDPMIYLGRLNMNSDVRDISLPIRVTNKSVKGYLYVNSSCYQLKIAGTSSLNKEVEASSITNLSIELDPKTSGNMFCDVEIRLGAAKKILKVHALVQDKGVQ